MKHIFSIIILTLGLASTGCQKISEYYTQKNVFKDCKFSPASSELNSYLNFCGKTFKDPSLTISTYCLERAEALVPELPADCSAKYVVEIRKSIESIVTNHVEGIQDSPAAGGEPLTYESAARLLGRWSIASKTLYADSYFDVSKTEKGSFQAAYFSIFSKMKSRIVKLSAEHTLLALESPINKVNDPSFEKMGLISKIQTSALFEEKSPEVALEVLLPYLQSLAERAEVQLLVYQITCKLSRCTTGVDKNSRYQYMRLLSSYLDKDKLSSALKASNLVPQSIKNPFEIILANYDQIEGLLTGSERFPQPVLAKFKGLAWVDKKKSLRNFISYPDNSYVSRFVRISAHAIDLEDAFIANKTFDTTSVRRLSYNPSEESISLIASALADLNRRLETELVDFDDNKEEALNIYKNLIDLNQDSLALDVDRLSLNLADALNDLDVMRQSLTESRERQAVYLKEASLLASRKSDAFTVKDTQALTIAATDTKFDGSSSWKSLDDISPKDISYVAQDDNELVALSTIGRWQPVCALARSDLASYAEKGVTVGSGGYQVSFSNSSAMVNARGKERREIDYTDQGVRAEVCAHAGTPLGDNTGVTASACAYYQHGKRVEDTSFESTTQTETSQTSSAFEAGLRLPHTPLPNYPAGSVIAALETPSGQGSKIDRLFVVDNESVVVMQKNQKLRFILNDCLSTLSAGTIAIEIAPRISTNRATAALLNDFATVVASKDTASKKEKIIQSGPGIEQDLQALRSYIIATFVQQHAGDADYRKLPLVEPIFTAWLDQEILEVKKRHDIRMQERITRDLDLQYRASSVTMNSAERSGKIYSELFEQSLLNMDQSLLNNRLLDILSFLDTSMIPLIDIYFPGLNVKDIFTQLNSIPLDAPLTKTGDQLHDGLETINSTLLINSLYRNFGGTQSQNIVLRIPRPGISTNPTKYNVAGDAMRQLVWDYLLSASSKDELSLSIPISALYQKEYESSLSCIQILPIIESAMLGFRVSDEIGGDDDFFDKLGGSTDFSVGPNVQFASLEGAIDYRIINGTVNSSQVSKAPVRFATSIEGLEKAITVVQEKGANARAGYGFSPFGDFTFSRMRQVRDLASYNLGGNIDSLQEMVLVFKAKVQSTQTKPKWIQGCE